MVSQPGDRCSDYRAGQRLLSLKRQLDSDDLPPEERQRLEAEIAELEHLLGMD